MYSSLIQFEHIFVLTAILSTNLKFYNNDLNKFLQSFSTDANNPVFCKYTSGSSSGKQWEMFLKRFLKALLIIQVLFGHDLVHSDCRIG